MSLNRPNLASLVQVLLLPIDDITSFPDLNLERDAIESAVTTTGTWEAIDFTKHSAVLSEKAMDKKGVRYWTVEIAGDHVVNEQHRNDAIHKRYIADVTDANGLRMLIGTPDQPLRFETARNSGTPNKGNKNAIKLTTQLNERPPTYRP